jgi:hypothetical protein
MPRVTESLQTLDSAGIRGLVGKFKVTTRGGNKPVWTFPSQTGGDGCVGKLCVSECHRELVSGSTDDLAVHVTFEIPHLTIPSATTVRRDRRIAVAVTLQNLHFTARPRSSQNTISSVGSSSILQSQVSTHRGRTNDWMHRARNVDRLVQLATAIGLGTSNADQVSGAKAAIDEALAAYDGAALTDLGPVIVSTLQELIGSRLEVPTELGAFPVQVDVATSNW